MTRLKSIVAFVSFVCLLVLFVGCESEHTAPERVRPEPVDPVDWDGTKDNPYDLPRLGNSPSREGAGASIRADERSMGTELGPHDHTIIMEAILQNGQEIVARLPQNEISSGMEVLQAALTVPEISGYVKSRIRMVLDVLPTLEEPYSRIPEDTQEAVSQIVRVVEGCESLSEMTEIMQNMIDSGEYRGYEGLSQGLATGIRILRDGEKAVYTSRRLFNLKRLISHDIAGAIGGAIGGAIATGGPGAGVGAVAGAAGASAADAIGQLTGWW